MLHTVPSILAPGGAGGGESLRVTPFPSRRLNLDVPRKIWNKTKIAGVPIGDGWSLQEISTRAFPDFTIVDEGYSGMAFVKAGNLTFSLLLHLLLAA